MTDTPQQRAQAKYHTALASLAGQKGQRNGRLLGLASLGIMAGFSDDRILSEVRAASGNPPLTEGEIRHALASAHRDTAPLDGAAGAGKWTPPPKKPPPLGRRARDFVRRMIRHGTGTTGENLIASSPLQVPTEPLEQTAVFLRTLYATGDWLFCGAENESGVVGRNIQRAGDWPEWIAAAPDRLRHAMRQLGVANADGVPVTVRTPELLIANPLTGTEGAGKDGKPSYRCGACVAVGRFALVEFDALPLPEQCAFWAGVIRSGTLPLRALTFSGGKSIHGLVEIGAKDATAWEREIEMLLCAVANPDAPAEQQADRACKNPDRLTRLPGALRMDKGRVQSLLWLSRHALRYSPAVASRVQTSPTCTPPSATPRAPRPAPPVARSTVQAVAEPGTGPRSDRLPCCRDCWNWQPSGVKHGCAAGVAGRLSPDHQAPCPHADPVA